MKTFRQLILALTLVSPWIAHAQTARGKILVVVSSESELPLKQGKSYPTGYYLNELAVPAKRLVDAGYELVFANPKGNRPTMDSRSDDALFFGGDTDKRKSAKEFLRGLAGLEKPQKLSDVISSELDGYAGLFIPGGHAPMIDLMADRDLGRILRRFHQERKPTALICHGPIALLAATEDPGAYQKALIENDTRALTRLARSWPYRGYKMTVLSTAEEKQVEGVLGSEPLFYPANSLQSAGGVVASTKEWKSNVIRDRELITGQNPFSDETLIEEFMSALAERK